MCHVEPDRNGSQVAAPLLGVVGGGLSTDGPIELCIVLLHCFSSSSPSCSSSSSSSVNSSFSGLSLPVAPGYSDGGGARDEGL